MSDALIAGAVRGDDSCGLAVVNSKQQVLMHKDVLAPTSFLTSRATKALIDEVDNAYMVIGHNRAATVGGVTVDAAHPFAIEDTETGTIIYGVHNGTLSNYKLSGSDGEYVSDSEWLFGKLSAAAQVDGDLRTEAVADILSSMFGAYSVMFFFDDDPATFYLANNGRRPMHALMAEDGSYCLFASEAGMLHWLAERNDLKTTNNVMQAQADKLYVVSLTEATVRYTKVDIDWSKSMTLDATKWDLPAATEYTGTWSDLEELKRKYNGEQPTGTNVVPFSGGTSTADDLADLIAATRGTPIEFYVTEVDANTRAVFGTFWPSDKETSLVNPKVQELFYEGKFVIYCGNDGVMFDKLSKQPDVVWTGNVTSVARINTVDKDGKNVKIPHVVISLATVHEYESPSRGLAV